MFFSRSTPNLDVVIPAMDHISQELTKSSGPSSKYSLAIRAALALGKKTLDKYLGKIGESEVYRIAMGMFILYFYIHWKCLTTIHHM